MVESSGSQIVIGLAGRVISSRTWLFHQELTHYPHSIYVSLLLSAVSLLKSLSNAWLMSVQRGGSWGWDGRSTCKLCSEGAMK